MPNVNGQRGMSIIMAIFLVAMVAILGLTGLKLFPIYMESFKIDQALKGVIADSIESKSSHEIKQSLVRRFDIDDVRRITEHDFKDYVTITKKGDNVGIGVSYRAETSLFGNLSIAADFEKYVEN